MLPWWPNDYIAATRHLSLSERGAYTDLLFFQWTVGALPKDPVRLARLIGCDASEFTAIWPAIRAKFSETDAGLVNLRLEEHRAKAMEIREGRSRGAQRTNSKRWGTVAERSPSDSVSDTPSESVGASHPSPTSTSTSDPAPSPNPQARENHVERSRSTGRSAASSLAIERVFDHWRAAHRHPQARLDAKRRRAISKALETYSEAEVLLAIDGYRNSPHHMGQNDRGTVYDEIGLILRDAEHIDAGIRFARQPPVPYEKPTATDRVLAGLGGKRKYTPAPTTEQMQADIRAGLRDASGSWLGPRTEDGMPDYSRADRVIEHEREVSS